MAQEENISGFNYSGVGGGGSGGGGGGGGCRSKKTKPKKVPQRGLGVAQLEKIIEEQQKKDSLQTANILAPNVISSPSDANSYLALQKFRPNLPPFPNSVPPSPSNLSSSNTVFRHAQSAPNIEMLQESFSVLKNSNTSGGEMGSRAISSPRQESLPRLWGGDCSISVDHHGFAFDRHHFQPPPPSMVHSGISPSSVLSSHLEPPSNQSSHRNNYTPQLTEEDKMVGMKRCYPFSRESPSAPSLLCNFPSSYCSSSSRPDELALRSSGYTAVAEARNKSIRGNPLPNVVIRDDDESLNGDFLTLAPPSAASPSSKLKHKHHSDHEEYEAKQSFNIFPTKLPTDPNTNGVRKGSDEKDDIVDLNLKL